MLALGLLATVADLQAGDFKYSSEGNSVTITGYTGTGGVVNIPDAIDGVPVTRIESRSFVSCNRMTRVVIPDSVTYIGDQAFLGCKGLTTILVGPLNSTYASIDGVLFNKDKSLLIQCPGGKIGNYTIPDRVVTIGNGAFNSSHLSNITVGKGVTHIGDGAFEYCCGLSTLVFQGDAPVLGSSVFNLTPNTTIYYLPGSKGWESKFGDLPTEVWTP